MNRFAELPKKIIAHNYQKTLLVFLFFFAVLSLIYFPLDLFVSHDDGFFHIRFAELIRTQGWEVFSNFPWLPFSPMAPPPSHFIYYNFLFYTFLLPFTYIQPLFLGLKLASVTIGSLVFTTLYYVLLKLVGRGAFWWSVGAFALMGHSEVLRTIMGRPFALAPALLLLLLYFLHKKKYWGVVVVTLIYFYWHSATFFFPLGISLVYLIFEKFYRHQPNWRNLAAVSIGTLSASLITMVTTPGFFNHFYNIVIRSVYETILRKTVPLSAGGELYPSESFDFLHYHQILLSLLVVAGVWEIYQYLKLINGVAADGLDKNRTLQSCLFTLSFGALLATSFSYRNADFFVSFALIYIALSATGFFATNELASEKQRVAKLGLIIAIVYLFVGRGIFVHTAIARNSPYYSIEKVAGWLEENTPAKAVIFNVDWGDFPLLFYYNTSNRYVTGIDPRFLYQYNPRLYWLWHNLVYNGYVCEKAACEDVAKQYLAAGRTQEKRRAWLAEQGPKVAQIVRNEFNSRHIVTNSRFKTLNLILDTNPALFSPAYKEPMAPSLVYELK